MRSRMNSNACKREMMIRGGMTLIMSAIFYFGLDIDPIIWLLPFAVVAFVWVKWRVVARNEQEALKEEE